MEAARQDAEAPAGEFVYRQFGNAQRAERAAEAVRSPAE
jgi:hypothetical protein